MNLLERVLGDVEGVSLRNKKILVTHCCVVAEIAKEVGINYQNNNRVKLDMGLIEDGALIHDIGWLAVKIGRPIEHGEAGYEWMVEKKYPDKLARFCLTHVGVGFSKEEVEELGLDKNLNHMPETVEEKIVAYSDNFTSKGNDVLYWNEEKYVDEKMKKYGLGQFERWKQMKIEFGVPEGRQAKEIISRYNRDNENK